MRAGFRTLILCLSLISPAFASAQQALVESCHGEIPCYNQAIAEEVRLNGTKAGMDLLEGIAKLDPAAYREQHAMVHELGKASFVYHGNPTKALEACDTRFWSGCYHGTLQAYFKSLPVVTPDHMNALCPRGESPHSFLRYNCLHGAGHGLTVLFNYDVLKSLAHCDFLQGETWDRSSCYGGVFMEHLVSFQQHHSHHDVAGFLTKTDLHYPCSAVADKYRGSCWLIHTSAILTLNGHNWQTAFAECEKAEGYQETCAQSLGRDISGHTLRNQDQMFQLCRLGKEAQWGPCFLGGVQDVMLHDANEEPGITFCERHSHGPYKEACYKVVVRTISQLHLDPEARRSACVKIPDAVVQSQCLNAVDG